MNEQDERAYRCLGSLEFLLFDSDEPAKKRVEEMRRVMEKYGFGKGLTRGASRRSKPSTL